MLNNIFSQYGSSKEEGDRIDEWHISGTGQPNDFVSLV